MPLQKLVQKQRWARCYSTGNIVSKCNAKYSSICLKYSAMCKCIYMMMQCIAKVEGGSFLYFFINTQMELLKGLGIQSIVITDGKTPLNMYQSPEGVALPMATPAVAQ